ncbi:MAG: GspE/PulE family protein [Gammaproteobacteria bacterium]|nr:GspE/PulE family protein [Gammaproteobacteria bacterium]
MSNAFAFKELSDILVEKGFLKPEDLVDVSIPEHERLGDVLLKLNKISNEQLAQALAEQCGYAYINLDQHKIDVDLFSILSADIAYKLGIIPLESKNDCLTIAASDPYDLTLSDRIEKLIGSPVLLKISSREGIDACLKKSEGTAAILKDLSREFQLLIVREGSEGNEEFVSLDAQADPDDGPVITLVNGILLAALNKHASDIHMESNEAGVNIKYRVDGVLYPATETLDPSHQNSLVSRIKVMAQLDITERRVPQDGRFRLRYANRDIDFRVSILPTVFGEDVAIRILDRAAVSREFEELSLDMLGIHSDILQGFKRVIHNPHGMILMTGPTGSGKTTTLYAAIKSLNLEQEKVITIEDPVEYQLPGVSQIPVNEKKGLTFAKGLRAILRHDPDKIMVGEIRDEETANIAIQSALTGHMVFTTVHANDTIDVVERFRYLNIGAFEFASAVSCIMAQRLVRLVCSHCKTKKPIKANAFSYYGIAQSDKVTHDYLGKGCDQCNHTGYQGRTLITEFLSVTPDIKQLIIERVPLHVLRSHAIVAGMVSLRDCALSLVRDGKTSLEEVQRVTFSQ